MKRMKIGPIVTVMLIITCVTLTGTLAYFSDSEASTGNTFTAGTLDLTPLSWAVGGAKTWSYGSYFKIVNVAPGDTATTTNIDTKNDGDISAESLTFNISVTDSEPTTDTEPENAAETEANEKDISTKITVTYLKWSDTPNYATTDTDGDDWNDLVEVVEGTDPTDSTDTPTGVDNVVTLAELAPVSAFDITDVDGTDRNLAAGATKTLEIKLKLQPDTGNKYQGDRSTITLTLDAHQNEV